MFAYKKAMYPLVTPENSSEKSPRIDSESFAYLQVFSLSHLDLPALNGAIMPSVLKTRVSHTSLSPCALFVASFFPRSSRRAALTGMTSESEEITPHVQRVRGYEQNRTRIRRSGHEQRMQRSSELSRAGRPRNKS
jgi:hypothetical protein